MAKKKADVWCYDCKHAELMQWWRNPIIARCSLTGERYVARAMCVCRNYVKSNRTKEVKHYDRYRDG